MCDSLQDAHLLFEKKPTINLFSWNAMLRGYMRNRMFQETLGLYYQMIREGVDPDSFTFPHVLKACTALSALQEGRKIHDLIVEKGVESDNFVASIFIDMYSKHGVVEFACQVFDKMSERDVVTCCAMISGLVHNGNYQETLKRFPQMQLT